MQFIAINMNDFHANQNGSPSTTCEILFIDAKNKTAAGEWASEMRPNIAWSIVPKAAIDDHIIFNEA